MLKVPSGFSRKNVAKWFLKYDLVSTMRNLLPFDIKTKKQQLIVNVAGEPKMEGTNFELVGDFMEVMGQEIKDFPEWPDEATLDLRMDLIREEVEELEEGVRNRDLENVAKELTDLLYVVYGMGHSIGIDLDECFLEVQRSNLSKLDDNGKPVKNEAGKVVKGPNYSPADIQSILNV